MFDASYFVQNRPGKVFPATNIELQCLAQLPSALFENAGDQPNKLLAGALFRERGFNFAVAHSVSMAKELLLPQNLRGIATVVVFRGQVSVLTHARGIQVKSDLSTGQALFVCQSYAHLPTRTIISCVQPAKIVFLGQNPDLFVPM